MYPKHVSPSVPLVVNRQGTYVHCGVLDVHVDTLTPSIYSGLEFERVIVPPSQVHRNTHTHTHTQQEVVPESDYAGREWNESLTNVSMTLFTTQGHCLRSFSDIEVIRARPRAESANDDVIYSVECVCCGKAMEHADAGAMEHADAGAMEHADAGTELPEMVSEEMTYLFSKAN